MRSFRKWQFFSGSAATFASPIIRLLTPQLLPGDRSYPSTFVMMLTPANGRPAGQPAGGSDHT